MTDDNPEGSGKHKLNVIRWIFAIIGSLIMLFSGGCSLVFLGDLISRGRWADNYISVDMVLVIGPRSARIAANARISSSTALTSTSSRGRRSAILSSSRLRFASETTVATERATSAIR